MSTEPLPQADGDPRRFQIHGDPDQPTLVHVEKSGPAFEEVRLHNHRVSYPSPARRQLRSSLSAQTARAIGHVLNALDKRQMLDVMPAWTRLLSIMGLSVPFPGQTMVCRAYPRQSWEFPELKEAVVMALCYAETDERLVKWATADALLRGYAMTLAHGSESHLADPRHLATEDIERIGRNAQAYRDFAEGK